jgi:hypothetical protein
MRLINLLFCITFFAPLGLYAVDGLTIKNGTGVKIKVHIIDTNETIYETKEIQGGSTATMNKCQLGRIILVGWGEKEKDGRPKVIGTIMKTENSCAKKFIFTSSLTLIEDKDISIRPFIPR